MGKSEKSIMLIKHLLMGPNLFNYTYIIKLTTLNHTRA